MPENLYTPNCIRTFTGIYMNVFEPTPEMICIEDIAHALSNQCRFGGHLPEFYSVAQHSTRCCDAAIPKYKIEALLHDASEAYLLDIPSPIKKNLSNYHEIEHRLMMLIAEKFKFNYPLSDEVKELDKMALEFEWQHHMIAPFFEPPNLLCLTNKDAEKLFLNLFHEWKN